jgi:carbamoyl-phosphate synthase large subunit
MPRRQDLESVLVIGSGPIVIGQACEFDYSGTQACRVLKAEGLRVVLVNSNPATIMTDPEFADATYVEPITPEVVEKIIAKERPDALLPTLGGQTALNTAIALYEGGVLDRYGVELIGADVEAIQAGENRERFKEVVAKVAAEHGLNAESARSLICHTMDEVVAAAGELGYPVVVRPSFTMGGAGSGFAHDEDQLRRIAGAGLDASPTSEVLLEESILGWKEYELEVMRDRADNVVIVCSIENLDPMGVHTGDSITVAPAMTLTDREYQNMRDVAIGRGGHRRLQHPVRGAARHRAHDRDRDEPAGVAVVGAGVQGHRLPHRQDRGAAGGRLHPGRDPQRHHRRDPRLVRADARLRGGQGPAVRVREVPRRRQHAHHAHEVGGRGHGDRP